MKKLIIIIMLIPFFVISAHAENISAELIDETDIYKIQDALPQQEQEISGELKLDGSYDSNGALNRLGGRFSAKLRETAKSELSFVVSILSISFLCSLASSVCPNGNIAGYIDTAGCCTIAYMLSASVEGIISQSISAINQLSDYSRAAMPAIFTAAAACGAVGSASVKYAAACFAIEIFMSIARDIIIPLIYAYLAVSLSASIFDNSVLKSASSLCKNLAVYLMTGICIVFSGYIGISGLIAGSTDAMAVKTAKTVISNSLPVVGGIISDAASVVLASASIIKNTAGVFCLIAVCALCIGPFAVLSVKAFLYKAVSSATEMLPGNKMSALLKSIGSTMSMLLGLIGSCGIMLFISIMSGIKVINL